VDNAKLIDDDEIIKEFIKKDFLKFYITIYKFNEKNAPEDIFMLDIFLLKGPLLVFCDFSDRFFREVSHNISLEHPN